MGSMSSKGWKRFPFNEIFVLLKNFVFLPKQQTTNNKQQTTNNKQQTPNTKPQTPNIIKYKKAPQ